MSPEVLTNENFDTVISEAKVPVMIDFWASWCGPCRMLSPIIDEISEAGGTFIVAKVNIDEQPELASRFSVMSIPTVIVIKNGEVSSRSVGVKPKAELLAMLA